MEANGEEEGKKLLYMHRNDDEKNYILADLYDTIFILI
jgi:hypothetical protein